MYCFWATPPEYRTENYESLDVPDALRACSNILAIMADRWSKADCLRDVFELLAREIPLVDRPNKPPLRLPEKTVSSIRTHLPQIKSLVVHRPVLRMIEEIISENFPRSRSVNQSCQPPSIAGMLAPDNGIANNSSTLMHSVSADFQLPFAVEPPFDYRDANPTIQGLDVDGLLSFPGAFDYDNWL